MWPLCLLDVEQGWHSRLLSWVVTPFGLLIVSTMRSICYLVCIRMQMEMSKATEQIPTSRRLMCHLTCICVKVKTSKAVVHRLQVEEAQMLEDDDTFC